MSTAFVERTEVLVPGPAEGLAALLDLPTPDLAAGLPLLWHWIYLLERSAERDLGEDGHPVRNVVPAPPGPGRRRMWAGGAVTRRGALRLGEPATRRSEVLSVVDKEGRSGLLTFVTVGHTISQNGQVVIDERQDVVYRDRTTGVPAPPEAQEELPVEPDEWAIATTPPLLFRYSALTYNAHRIHYDRDFARDVEGYPGLLVHGPLQATLMAEAARASGAEGDLHFDYRLVAPLFDCQGMIARALPETDGIRTSIRDRFGRTTATGTLTRPASVAL